MKTSEVKSFTFTRDEVIAALIKQHPELDKAKSFSYTASVNSGFSHIRMDKDAELTISFHI